MARRQAQSTRLTRTTAKQNRKQTLIFTLGIILILFGLIQFGPYIVKGFGDFMYSLRGPEQQESQQDQKVFLSPPALSSIPEATQNQYVTLQGKAPEENGTVEIYLNNELIDEIEIGSKLEFEVKDILLSSGQNSIKARFTKEKSTSAFSTSRQISYIKDEPKLEVSFPNDNATFVKADKNIVITGQTDPENVVTVNGFRAIVNSEGGFTYQYQLNDGENILEMEAINLAGTATKKSLKVSYSP